MGEPSKGWDAFVRVACAILIAAVLGSAGYMLRLNERLIVIEANRFTARDGHELESLIVTDRETSMAQYNSIMLVLQTIRAVIPQEFPPPKFVKRVDELEDRVRDLETK